MAGDVGRPLAALVFSSEAKRSFPERPAHRRRVARSMPDHCRITLCCAEGLPKKVEALEPALRVEGCAAAHPRLREDEYPYRVRADGDDGTGLWAGMGRSPASRGRPYGHIRILS